jgi:hypothetical protein
MTLGLGGVAAEKRWPAGATEPGIKVAEILLRFLEFLGLNVDVTRRVDRSDRRISE